MNLQQLVQDHDVKTGATMAALGVTGTTVQVVTQWASLAVLMVNLLLGIGGLYVLAHKILAIHRKKP